MSARIVSKKALAAHVLCRVDALERDHGFDRTKGSEQVNDCGEEMNRAYGKYSELLLLVDVFGIDRPEVVAVERPRQKVVECDPSDGKVHVRRSPSAATIEPALCGKRGQTTTSSAWGFYGPGGDGFDEMCLKCVAAERSRGAS